MEPAFETITPRRIRRGGQSTLKVELERYTAAHTPVGLTFYSYHHLCACFSEYAQLHTLTDKLSHEPGQCMFVAWAGCTMTIVEPTTGETTNVSEFVARLPYSGIVFAKGFFNETLSSSSLTRLPGLPVPTATKQGTGPPDR